MNVLGGHPLIMAYLKMNLMYQAFISESTFCFDKAEARSSMFSSISHQIVGSCSFCHNNKIASKQTWLNRKTTYYDNQALKFHTMSVRCTLFDAKSLSFIHALKLFLIVIVLFFFHQKTYCERLYDQRLSKKYNFSLCLVIMIAFQKHVFLGFCQDHL